jgi:hypothetical protein
VSYPDLRPFLFHAEFHDILAQTNSIITAICIISGCFEKKVVIAGLIVDHLFYQRAELPFMGESAEGSRIKGSVILSHANDI